MWWYDELDDEVPTEQPTRGPNLVGFPEANVGIVQEDEEEVNPTEVEENDDNQQIQNDVEDAIQEEQQDVVL